MRGLVVIVGTMLSVLLNASYGEDYVVRRLFLPADAEAVALKVNTTNHVDLRVLPDIHTEVPLWELLEPTSTNGHLYTYDLLPEIRNPARYFRLDGLPPEDCADNRSVLIKIGRAPENLNDLHVELETIKNGRAKRGVLNLHDVDDRTPMPGTAAEQSWITLDISALTMREDWLVDGNPLQDLPIGLIEFDEVPYNLTSHVWSPSPSGSSVVIPVDQQVTALHFLHAVADADEIPLRVATYTVRYEDGHTQRIPIVSGVNIMNITSGYGSGGSTEGSVDVRDAPVAWRGRYPGHVHAAVYSYCWRNPQPWRGIESITIEPAETGNLALIAATAEGQDGRRVRARAVSDRYLITTEDVSISSDLILENQADRSTSCTGTLSLVEASTGNIVESININESLAINEVLCRSYSFEVTAPLSTGCYDIKFSGESSGVSIRSKSIRIAVVEPSGELVKGVFPHPDRAFFTMTIGDMDNRAAQKLSALGFDVAYVQPKWASQETAPGVYDFSVINRAVSLATNNNLAVAVGSVTWTTPEYGPIYGVPAWINGRMVSRLGTSVHDGTIFDDSFMGSLTNYWRAMAEHTLNIPSVVAYVPTASGNDHMLNFGGGIYGEPGHLYDYSSYAEQKWYEWLETESGYSLSALEAELGMSFAGYDDVPVPKYKIEYGEVLWRLWMTFRRDSVIGAWKDITTAIRNEDAAVGIEVKHSGGWLPWGNMQGSYFDETINVAAECGGSLLKTGSEWTDQFIVPAPLAAHRGLSVGAEMAILPPPHEAFKAAMFNLMRYQGNQAVYVYWGVGEPTYNWAEYKPYWDRVLSAQVLDQGLCLLYSTWSMLHEGIAETDEVNLHRSETLTWGYILSNAGVYFDATTDVETNLLNQYSVILDANSGGHPDAYWDKLEDYIRSGGTLILPHHAGTSQGYHFQHDVLGVQFDGNASGQIRFSGQAGFVDGYNADDGVELSATNANIIARWANDSPAAVEVSLGSGKVLCLGFPLAKYQAQSYAWPIAKELLSRCGIHPHVDAPPSLQSALFKEGAGKYLLIAFNHDVENSDPVTVQLPEAYPDATYRITNVLTGEQRDISSVSDGNLTFSMTCRALTTEIITIQKLDN